MAVKKLTKAQEKLLAKLTEKRDNAHGRIYYFGPDDRTVWSECYKLASFDAQECWKEADKALRDFQYQMVQEGRGWYNTFGGFQPY